MEKLLIIVAAISLLVIVALFVLGLVSQSGRAPGLVEGRLAQCPGTPNCLNSEYAEDTEHFVEPLAFAAGQEQQVFARLKAIIGEMGGSIQVEDGDYLAATFTSSLFRYVDDLELRIDSDENVVHLRSASRVGRKDFGANQKRIERLKQLW